MPNVTGVGLVVVHVTGQLPARVGATVLGCPAQALQRQPLAARDAEPEGLADNAQHVL